MTETSEPKKRAKRKPKPPPSIICTTPFCIVCQSQIPAKRARKRTVTCKPKCLYQTKLYYANAPTGPAELHCIVCKKAIDETRARIGRSATCSNDCAEAYRAYRTLVISLYKCPYCVRPCTPRERELFHAWRTDTQGSGQAFIKVQKRGAPKSVERRKALEDQVKAGKRRAGALAVALREAITELESTMQPYQGEKMSKVQGWLGLLATPENAIDVSA